MQLTRGVLIVALVIVPSTSLAQTAAPSPDRARFFLDVAISGAAGSAAKDREFLSRFVRFGEIASSEAGYPKPSRAVVSPLAEVGGGLAKSWLQVGFSYGRTTYSDPVALEATIPHPLFLNVPATGAGAIAELKRRETATNVYVAVVPVRTNRTEWRVQFGPTFFRYRADMVREVQFAHTFATDAPTSSIAITGGATDRVEAKALGAHVGFDFTYFLTSRIGLGGRIRYSQGTVTITPEPLSALQQEIRVGGTLIFAGLRVRVGG